MLENVRKESRREIKLHLVCLLIFGEIGPNSGMSGSTETALWSLFRFVLTPPFRRMTRCVAQNTVSFYTSRERPRSWLCEHGRAFFAMFQLRRMTYYR